MRERGSADGQARCNAGFDEDPAGYDDLRAAGHMARRRLEYFLGVVDATPGPVVEIGCGTGTLLRGLAAARPDRTFLGVDPLPGYVGHAREHARAAALPGVRFEVGTAESLDDLVDPGSVGLLVSVDALHHVADLDAVVTAAHRAVAPGGRWRAMEPNRLHPYVWAYHVLTPGERTFAVGDFRRRARRAGWAVCGRDDLFLVPSGVDRLPPWAQRLERRAEWFRPLAGAAVLDLVRPVSAARGR
ncbi:class I SAM-dependent methyltransferase [Blastococcus sp. SYSU D00695]